MYTLKEIESGLGEISNERRTDVYRFDGLDDEPKYDTYCPGSRPNAVGGVTLVGHIVRGTFTAI